MSRIAAPDYVTSHALAQCPPGHRFGLYIMDLWHTHWSLLEGAKAGALKRTTGLGDGAKLLEGLLERQLALAQALPAERRLVVDAQAAAPFATGLGQEHPVENGFAFLIPYGLPYLAGSGVKGVLRRAAQLLRDEREQGFAAPVIDALFGPEDPGAAGSGKSLPADGRRRGALSCWDVFPQPPNGELAVEIMTPHHGAYYEGKDSPHDAGQPNPIPFLALPAGSKLRFVITFEPALWPADLAGAEWQPIVERTLAHAFEWVGFGAKTAVGYGAMREDEDSRRRRENAAAEQRAAKEAAEAARRRATLPPEEAELDERRADLERFAHALDTVRGGRYQKGGPFDQERKAFLEKALSWQHRLARTKAAALLRESYKLTDWPAKKERKAEVKAWLARLDGNP